VLEKRKRRATAVDAAANSFAGAARDFVERYSMKKVRRWREQARLLGLDPRDGLSLIPKGLADRWRDRPVASIDGHDVHGVVAETRERGAPGLERRSDGETESRARAMLSCLSRLFRWLVQHRRVEKNPCADVHRPEAPKARERVLTKDEIVALWRATDKVGEPAAAVLRLLLLTGCRLGEVAGMHREELDGETWTIPGERTKNHRTHKVPLAPLARDIIDGVPRIDGCPLLFSTTGRTPVSGWSKIKKRVDGLMGAHPRSAADRGHRHGRARRAARRDRDGGEPRLRIAGRYRGHIQSERAAARAARGARAVGLAH
jgi:integrase